MLNQDSHHQARGGKEQRRRADQPLKQTPPGELSIDEIQFSPNLVHVATGFYPKSWFVAMRCPGIPAKPHTCHRLTEAESDR